MKAEINNENKDKFFSTYWGQEVAMFRSDNHNDFDLTVGYQLPIDKILCLRLKTLSQISDEDAIDVAKIIMISTYEKQSPNFKEVILKFLQSFDKYRFSFEITLRVADYLRSKGYALPWMGLSVDEMVQVGWIKLTEQ